MYFVNYMWHHCWTLSSFTRFLFMETNWKTTTRSLMPTSFQLSLTEKVPSTTARLWQPSCSTKAVPLSSYLSPLLYCWAPPTLTHSCGCREHSCKCSWCLWKTSLSWIWINDVNKCTINCIYIKKNKTCLLFVLIHRWERRNTLFEMKDVKHLFMSANHSMYKGFCDCINDGKVQATTVHLFKSRLSLQGTVQAEQ